MATELSYILKQDVLSYIDASTLDELTGGKRAIGSASATSGDDLIWEKLIPNAKESVKGYSRHWYDMDKEMRPYYEYSDTSSFTEGDRVASEEDDDGNRDLYLCIQDAAEGIDLTDTDYFEPVDSRNSVVLECSVLILIYNLSRRKNPRQVPEQRQTDYNRAIDTLKDIQRGRITLEIAQREIDEDDLASDAGQTCSYGNFENVTQDDY